MTPSLRSCCCDGWNQVFCLHETSPFFSTQLVFHSHRNITARWFSCFLIRCFSYTLICTSIIFKSCLTCSSPFGSDQTNEHRLNDKTCIDTTGVVQASCPKLLQLYFINTDHLKCRSHLLPTLTLRHTRIIKLHPVGVWRYSERLFPQTHVTETRCIH